MRELGAHACLLAYADTELDGSKLQAFAEYSRLCFEDDPDAVPVPGGKDGHGFGETARLQSLPGATWK